MGLSNPNPPFALIPERPSPGGLGDEEGVEEGDPAPPAGAAEGGEAAKGTATVSLAGVGLPPGGADSGGSPSRPDSE